MSSVRLAFVLALAACASNAPAKIANRAGNPPPPMPATMVAADLDALVAHQVLTPIDLPEVSRTEEYSPIGDDSPVPDGQIRISDAMPNGWSETVYADGAHRLWIVSRTETMHVPEGVIISATRVFTTTLTIPPGYVVGGSIRIVG